MFVIVYHMYIYTSPFILLAVMVLWFTIAWREAREAREAGKARRAAEAWEDEKDKTRKIPRAQELIRIERKRERVLRRQEAFPLAARNKRGAREAEIAA